MATKYFALLTSRGREKLATAAVDGTRLNITSMAVGDGHGTLPVPSSEQMALVNEKRRDAINLLTVDPVNTNQIIAEQVIPESEGGFWIREIGLYDTDGDLIAVANCAESYKPQLQEGSGRTMTIRMVLIVSSSEFVALKIDPSVVLATRQFVEDSVIEVKHFTHDLVSELSYVFPSAFGVKADGSDCGKAFEALIRHLMATGKTAMLPAGEINMGKNRPVFNYEPGMKPWKIISNGTTITFDDVPAPAIDTAAKNWGGEAPLFTFSGKSSTEYLPQMVWENVNFDYSRQSNKGGTLPENIGICHPTPYSTGCRVFKIDLCLNLTFRQCTFSNVYGDAFWFLRCTNPVVENCSLFDVSANQLVARLNKAMNLDSNGGGIFFHSCWGGRATGNLIVNKRVYEVSMLSPDTGVEMKGTPCGYIGIWAEYALDRGNLPPLVYWETAKANKKAQFVVICENVVSGYTMGIKTEATASASIDSNTIRNCYLPIVFSGTYSQATKNHIELKGVVAGTVPQGGFSTRGGITLFHFAGAGDEFNGTNDQALVSGNYVYTEGAAPPVSVYGSGGARVIHNKFVIAGSAKLFEMTSLEKTGYVFDGNTWILLPSYTGAGDTLLRGAKGFSFKTNLIANKSSKLVRCYFSGAAGESQGIISENVFEGGVDVRLKGDNITLEKNIYKPQDVVVRLLQVLGNNCQVLNNTIYYQLNSNTPPLLVTGHNGKIKDNKFIGVGDATSGGARAVIEQYGYSNNLELSGNAHLNNLNNMSLMAATSGLAGLRADNNVTNSVSAVMIYQAGLMLPPVYMKGNGYGGGLIGGFSSSDPNSFNRLGNMRETPYIGMEVPFILPEAGGYKGCFYSASGWKRYGMAEN